MFIQLPERDNISGEDVRTAYAYLDKYLADRLTGVSEKLPHADLDASGMIAFAMGLERLQARLREDYPIAAQTALNEAVKLRENARDGVE